MVSSPAHSLSTPAPQLLAFSDQPEAAAAAPWEVDVVIVGGGIVGLTLAAALRYTNLAVAVIEAQTPEQAASRQRAYALSQVSGEILQELGLWSAISPHITHFQRVRLSDANFPKTVEFLPEDGGTAAVYYAAEHPVLMAALQRCIDQADTLHYLSSTQLLAVTPGEEATYVKVQTGDQVRTLKAALVVAADGAKSVLRQQAGIQTLGWKYWQSCITTVLAPEKSHEDTAYERFWPSGPFAILPLPGNRCQIVWTAPHAEAQAMLNLPRDQFMAELRHRFGDQMGQLTLLSEPLMFPVQLLQSRHYVQPRLALVGDAAHCCHPVGGQGLNMGIRDAAALAEVVIKAYAQGRDVGSQAVLRRYDGWRRRENWLILSFTDFLTRCFSNQIWPLVSLRHWGIALIQRVRPLKRLLLKLMTGRFGHIPHPTHQP